MYYEAIASYYKETDKGVKKVREKYLCDAVNLAESEARLTEEIIPFTFNSGEVVITAFKHTKIAEIFEDYVGDRYYSVVAAFITIDEKSGAEKRSKHNYLVKAIDFRNALENFVDAMTLLVDYEIVSISETAIMDVFHVKTEEE